MSYSDADAVKIDSESPSVQTHLSILQNVIQRMAGNSANCKTACVTLVSAILVIVADKGKPEYTWIATFPTIVFCGLDAYYLALEKGFRQSYNRFVSKIHRNSLTDQDIYSVLPVGNISHHQCQAIKSFSVWGYYLSLLCLIGLVKFIAGS